MYNLYECPSFTCVWNARQKTEERKKARALQRNWFYLAIINVLWMWDMWAFCVWGHLNFQSHFNLKHCTCCGIGEIKYTHTITTTTPKKCQRERIKWKKQQQLKLIFIVGFCLSFEADGSANLLATCCCRICRSIHFDRVDKNVWGEIHVINNVLTRCALWQNVGQNSRNMKRFFMRKKWIFSHSDCP